MNLAIPRSSLSWAATIGSLLFFFIAPPAAAWTPKNLPGLWAWWDASQNAAVKTDDKELVKSITDLSGNGRDLIADGRDIKKISNVSTKLDGVRLWMPLSQDLRIEQNQKLTGPAFDAGKDFTALVVWSRLRYPKAMVGGPPLLDADRPLLKIGNTPLLTVGKSPLKLYAFGKSDAPTHILSNNMDLAHVCGAAIVKKGATADLWLNGKRVQQAVACPLGDKPMGAITFSEGAALGLCELILIPRVLTDAELQQAWAYLARWEPGKRRWLGVLSAGQSNAGMMNMHGGYKRAAATCKSLTGALEFTFAGSIDGGASQGTYHGGTTLCGGFLGLNEGGDPADATQWTPKVPAQDCVAFWKKTMVIDPAFEPLAFFWFQGESDIKNNPGFTKESYKAGLIQLAGYFRKELNMPKLPFFAPNLHTYGYGSTPGHIQIRQVYKDLEDLPGNPNKVYWLPWNAFDIDGDNDKAGSFGGAHMSAKDCLVLGPRLGYTLAWKLNQLEGKSPAVPTTGPAVIAARRLSETEIEVALRHDFGNALQPLNETAASGVGWSWTEDGSFKGKPNHAVKCEILTATRLRVTFKDPLPHSGKPVIWYCRGWCRLAVGQTSGHGNSIYDNAATQPIASPLIAADSRVNMPLQPTLYGIELK